MKTNLAINTNLCIYERVVTPQANIRIAYKLLQGKQAEGSEYSILITFSGGTDSDEILLEDVSRDKTCGLALLEILADGEVDPCSAPYIIEELLCQDEFL